MVGKWIRQLYQVITDGIAEGRWFYDERLANNAIGFIQRYCHHYKGVLAPKRLKLSLWQRAAISVIFGIVDETGKRQFREVFWVVGRKQGKTLLAAAIASYMAYAAGNTEAKSISLRRSWIRRICVIRRWNSTCTRSRNWTPSPAARNTAG